MYENLLYRWSEKRTLIKVDGDIANFFSWFSVFGLTTSTHRCSDFWHGINSCSDWSSLRISWSWHTYCDKIFSEKRKKYLKMKKFASFYMLVQAIGLIHAQVETVMTLNHPGKQSLMRPWERKKKKFHCEHLFLWIKSEFNENSNLTWNLLLFQFLIARQERISNIGSGHWQA